MTRTQQGRGGRLPYRAGIAIAILASLLTVWTTTVRDDGNGIGFFMLILTVAVGWASARFQATGMMRTMIGVAGMQILLGIAIATAPVTAAIPGASTRILGFCVGFAVLWLLSAACLGIAAKRSGNA